MRTDPYHDRPAGPARRRPGRTAPALAGAAAALLAALTACSPGDGDAQPGGPVPTPTTPQVTPADPGHVEFADVTLTLPAWPAEGIRDLCPQGSHEFVDGEAETATDRRYYLPFLLEPVYADLDGDSVEEVLVPIGCGLPASEADVALLALRVRSDGALETMGYVQGDASFYRSVADFRVLGTEVVLETVDGLGPDADRQVRHFEWRDDRFVQTQGPTAEPAP